MILILDIRKRGCESQIYLNLLPSWEAGKNQSQLERWSKEKDENVLFGGCGDQARRILAIIQLMNYASKIWVAVKKWEEAGADEVFGRMKQNRGQ